MTATDARERPVREVVEILQDYRDDLVLIGGWVPYLQLTYGRARVADPRTSLTVETDLLVPRELEPGARQPITEILTAAGFEMLGESGAVWVRAAEDGGATIEFMTPKAGPARRRGGYPNVPGQPQLRAVDLEHLEVMARFNEIVHLHPDVDEVFVAVRVPTLGAFVINKANTFNLRGGSDKALKAGKDLLYLRDVAAAGEHPLTIVEEDVGAIVDAGSMATVGRAGRHLRMAAANFHADAAAILAERDGTEMAKAKADVAGHLEDIAEIIRHVAPE